MTRRSVIDWFNDLMRDPAERARMDRVIKRAKREAFAVKLAAEHLRKDPETRVYLSPHESEIRLVEVSPSVTSSRDYTVNPPVLGPMFSMFLPWVLEYVTHLVLLSEEEWSAYVAGTLPLPEGWAPPVPV
jgi:hypothetical protein